jgi:hypothetical protein
MIKIYTDTSYITPQNRKIIFPLLLDLCYINNLNLLENYRIVSVIEEADIVIVPVQIDYFFKNKKEAWLYDFIDEAIQLKKKVWVYSSGDFGITLNRSVYTFRLGGFDSKLDDKTVIVPALITDPYNELEKEFHPIAKSLFPAIGFVGNANGSLVKWCKEITVHFIHNLKRKTKNVFADSQPFYPSGIKRHQFLSALQKNDKINTDFIFRKKYRAGAKTESEKKRTTLEFLENINGSPYTFCLRGAGNFSIRFYETLAMGRIPFVIDTDICLPLAAIIPWKKHYVLATEKDFMEQFIRFHNAISEKDFEQMQINNRILWLSYLNREAYFNSIYVVFKKLL